MPVEQKQNLGKSQFVTLIFSHPASKKTKEKGQKVTNFNKIFV